MFKLKDAEKPQHAENRRVEVHAREHEHRLDVPVQRRLRAAGWVSSIGHNGMLGTGYTASILGAGYTILPVYSVLGIQV